MSRLLSHLLVLCLLCFSINSFAEQNYLVKQVKQLPKIDGSGDDIIWSTAKTIELIDTIAKHKLYFSALHNGKSIAIKVRYPDDKANLEHKTLIWDKVSSRYKAGSKREDTMVLKWAMNPFFTDISLSSNSSYQADIWFWKSYRTDPMGYADDKIQIYSKIPKSKATRLRSKNSSLFFLQRKGDQGNSSYTTNVLMDKKNLQESRYIHRQPSGSRADIKAKGKWQNGEWIIEFLRKLDTGYSDDVRLVLGETVLLALSRYEVAGRKADNKLEQPLFGSGEIGELIKLTIEK